MTAHHEYSRCSGYIMGG